MALARRCIPALALLGSGLAVNVHADDWWGQDKAQHFVGAAALSSVIAVGTRNPDLGFWSGVAAGAAKEVWDQRHAGHQASTKDFAWSVAGAYAGSQGSGWILRRSGGQTVVGYAWKF